MAKIVTSTKTMKRCIEKMMQDASRGKGKCRYSIYYDTAVALQKEGLKIPSFNLSKVSFSKKNPVKLIISWDNGENGTAKVLAKRVNNYRDKYNKKYRTLKIKQSRKEKFERKRELAEKKGYVQIPTTLYDFDVDDMYNSILFLEGKLFDEE